MSLAAWRPIGVVAIANLYFDLAFGKDTVQTRRLYSEAGQDKWALKNTDGPGTFLEIGAHDADSFSNTRLLEEFGWNGVCVEPFPENFDKINRTCKLLSYALVREFNPDRQYSNCEDGSGVMGHSGFTKKNKNSGATNCTRVTVPQMTVSDLQSQLPPVLDFISLDVEGLELEILDAWSFEKTCSKLWTIEAETPRTQTPLNSLFRNLGCETRQAGYDIFAICHCGDKKSPAPPGMQGQMSDEDSTNLLDIKDQLAGIRRFAAWTCFFAAFIAAVTAGGCLCKLLGQAVKRRRCQEQARYSPQGSRIGTAEDEDVPIAFAEDVP